MTVTEILKELEHLSVSFPRQAMQQAVENREAITPELLRVLAELGTDPVAYAQRKDYMAHIYAMFLLAQFREKQAYRPIVKFFSAPGEIIYELVGDVVTENLKQILASVYDGDSEPLYQLVENPNVDEYVRSASINTFLVLHATGQISREDAVAYYRNLFQGRLERSSSHTWNALVHAVARLPAPELLDEVRQAFADELTDPGYIRLESVEQAAAGPPRLDGDCRLITDAISELEWWDCFKAPNSKWEELSAKLQAPQSPISRLLNNPVAPPLRTNKVNRNDPCPCSSGKKFKRCCGKS